MVISARRENGACKAVGDGISACGYGTLFAPFPSGVRDRPVFDKERIRYREVLHP